MAEYVYPNSDYDRPKVLLATLGSYWAETYLGVSQVTDVIRGKGQVENQTVLDLMETIAAISRYTVPIFHRDNWYALRLLASERNTSKTSPLRYDTDGTYNAGFSYDVPRDRLEHAFPAPDKLSQSPIIFNRFTEPSLTWMEGTDYVLDETDSALIFRLNPFEDARVAKRDVYERGVVVDEEALLWVFKGGFDFDYVYRQFSYVLGIRLKSSKAFRDFMNAIFDAVVGGTSAKQVAMAFAAMTGLPLVLEPVETVTNISADANNRLIITDQHVYKFPLATTPTVEVGDIVTSGDTLVDALEVIEFNRGILPDSLTSLAMGKGFLTSCYFSDLIFENKEVPLEVDADHPSGFTYLSWGLGGFPADVKKFFDDMHERGVEVTESPADPCKDDDLFVVPGEPCEEIPPQVLHKGTLAHLLDVRPNPDSEPTAVNLPDTINPLGFLVANVLRNNAFVVRVKTIGCCNRGVGLQNVRSLKKIIPPHTAMILVVELTSGRDSVTVDNVSETLGTFTGMEPLSEEASESVVDESRMTIKVVSGTCQ